MGIAAVVTLVGGSAAGPAGALPQHGLTVEEVLAIRHPSEPAWSPAGDRLAFLWNDGGIVDLWTVSAEGGAEPESVTAGVSVAESVTEYVWMPDGGLVWSDGEIHRRRPGSATAEPLTSTPEPESGLAPAPEGDRIAFLRAGDLWVVEAATGRERRLTEEIGAIGPVVWSPSGTHLALLTGAGTRTAEETAALLGDGLAFYRQDRPPADLVVVPAAGGEPRWLERGDAFADAPGWSTDGRLAWQQIDPDARGRRILIAEGPGWEPREIVAERDPAWWSLAPLDAGPSWEPGSGRLAYLSDRDGWTHLWIVDTRAQDPEPVQLTAGRFEVEAPGWHPEGGLLVLAANRGSASERALHRLVVGEDPGGPLEPEPISRLRGTSTAPAFSPDGERIAFLHADPARPLDLWMQEPRDAAPVRLTDSRPEGLAAADLAMPVVVRFRGEDGKLVPAQLFVPPDAGEGPVPAIVWAHGGGVRQNRFGWHPTRGDAIYYGLNQLLVQRGYVVLAVDYRGSAGYGREFRVAAHRDLGGIDAGDLLAAARYLRRLDEPRVEELGLWGLSYGGTLTLEALLQAPGVFDAGVDVAGVADWADWARPPGRPWILGRMGELEDARELYRERSPVHRVHRLRDPLLVLHGTADTTVPVLQSLRLADALLRAGGPFDMMIYPGEQHVFVHRRTWRDAFRRVAAFFGEHLR